MLVIKIMYIQTFRNFKIYLKQQIVLQSTLIFKKKNCKIFYQKENIIAYIGCRSTPRDIKIK
jgi:hypothetical protein